MAGTSLVGTDGLTFSYAAVNEAPAARASLAVGIEDTSLVPLWSDFVVADADADADADVDGDTLAITLKSLPAQARCKCCAMVPGAWPPSVRASRKPTSMPACCASSRRRMPRACG